jgi:sec-independent protein translocase protein TatC
MTVLEHDEMTAGSGPVTTDPESGVMTLGAHLTELRRRLVICAIAVTLTTLAAWFLYNHVLHLMVEPYRDFLLHHPHKDISGGNLVTTGPLEGFTTRLTISFYLGLIAACPVWLAQLWLFVAPGLHRSERRYAGSFTASAVALFAMGVTTAVLVFPKAIAWMINVSGTGVVPLFSPSKYLTLYALCCLVFGAAFTYPIVLVFLELVGVVSSAALRRRRRYAIVILVAVAAFITPSNDPFSFLAMAIPLLLFYEGSILVGRLLKR